MGIGDIFEIGNQGLQASRQSLQTTSNNIANANTPGYSRQRPVVESRSQTVTDGVVLGGGVNVPRVIRVHDAFVDRQLTDELREYGTAKIRSEGLAHVESLLHKGDFEIGDLTNKFFNSYRELSANPETPSLRVTVAAAAKSAAQGFRGLSTQLDALKSDLDTRLTQTVEGVNSMTKELASLNVKIERFELQGMTPNELLDRRDAVVRDLSQKLGYPVITNEQGHVNFGATGIGALVNSGEANDLVVARTPADGKKAAGALDIFVKDAFGLHKVTGTFKDGEIAGMIEVRDDVVNETKQELDRAAFEFSKAVNDVHKTGYGADGSGGKALFTEFEGPTGAAEKIDVSDDVKNNSQAIAAAMDSHSAGDNRIALQIADLQNKALLPPSGAKLNDEESNRSFTLNESLNSLMGGIANQTAEEKQMFDHQEAIMGQLENYRQSVSGVSLEEEALHMMQNQAVFNASAKTMKMGDELLQTILSLKA